MQKLELEAKEFMEKRHKGKLVCPKCSADIEKDSSHKLNNGYTVEHYICNKCDTFAVIYMK